MKLGAKVILIGVLLTTAASADAATYYVCTTGCNETGDGTEGRPWQTMAAVESGSSEGDTIVVTDVHESLFAGQWPSGRIYRSQGVTRHGITWTFDDYYNIGRFVNGDWWVKIPDGEDVKITRIEPEVGVVPYTETKETATQGYIWWDDAEECWNFTRDPGVYGEGQEFWRRYDEDPLGVYNWWRWDSDEREHYKDTRLRYPVTMEIETDNIMTAGMIKPTTARRRANWVSGWFEMDGDELHGKPHSVRQHIINGTMKNPLPLYPDGNGGWEARQGFETRLRTLAWGIGTSYDIDLNVAAGVDEHSPLVMASPSSLVTMTSMLPNHNHYFTEDGAVLTVLLHDAFDHLPEGVGPEDCFRPGYCGHDKTVRFTKYDLDYSRLANLPHPATSFNKESYEDRFERTWFETYGGHGVRKLHPRNNMPDYGGTMMRYTAHAALILNLDYPQAEKEFLMIRLVQTGLDFYSMANPSGEGIPPYLGREAWRGNGGVSAGRKLAIVFAAHVLDSEDARLAEIRALIARGGNYLYVDEHGNSRLDAGGYPDPYGPGNPPPDYFHFHEDDQTTYITRFDYDYTHGLAEGWPAWSPDERRFTAARYREGDIGMPEWIDRYAEEAARRAGRNIRLPYRALNSCEYPAMVLVLLAMDMKELWNHNAFFDYTDRYVDWIHGEPDPACEQETEERFENLRSNSFTRLWVWDLWHAHREKLGAARREERPAGR